MLSGGRRQPVLYFYRQELLCLRSIHLPQRRHLLLKTESERRSDRKQKRIRVDIFCLNQFELAAAEHTDMEEEEEGGLDGAARRSRGV